MKNIFKVFTVTSTLLFSTFVVSNAYAWGLSSTGFQLGDYYYENFSNGMSCTTTTLGDYTYTNCF